MNADLLHDEAIARLRAAGLLLTGREYVALTAARMATAKRGNQPNSANEEFGYTRDRVSATMGVSKVAIDRAKYRRTA